MPEILFKNSVLEHLDRANQRQAIDRQNQNWSIELFRQATVNSIKATHLRDSLTQLQSVVKEVEIVMHDIQVLMPIIEWVWNEVKNRPDLMQHMSAIEEKVRELTKHHEKHGHFFELYKKNQQSGLDLFKTVSQDLLALFSQPDGWVQDPVLALQRIHDAQDSVVMTGLFLELLSESFTQLQTISDIDQRKIDQAIRHLSAFGQKLHIKEDRLRKVIQTTQQDE